MALGAIETPEVVAKLREIGEYVLNQSSALNRRDHVNVL